MIERGPLELPAWPDWKPSDRTLGPSGRLNAIKHATQALLKVSTTGAQGLAVDRDGPMSRTMPQGAAVVLTHFRVQEEFDDHVVAKEVVGDELAETETLLAKPPDLRESERPFGRNLPKYRLPGPGGFHGALVLASQGISNGTGVIVDSTPLIWEIYTVDTIPPAHITVTDEQSGSIEVQPVYSDGTPIPPSLSWKVLPG